MMKNKTGILCSRYHYFSASLTHVIHLIIYVGTGGKLLWKWDYSLAKYVHILYISKYQRLYLACQCPCLWSMMKNWRDAILFQLRWVAPELDLNSDFRVILLVSLLLPTVGYSSTTQEWISILLPFVVCAWLRLALARVATKGMSCSSYFLR